MIALISLFVFSARVRSDGLPRTTAAAIKSDLSILNGDYRAFIDYAQNYVPSSQGFVNLYTAMNTIDGDTNKTTNDAKLEPSFSVADGQVILSYIHDTLEPSVRTAVEAYMNRRPQISDFCPGTVTYSDSRWKQIKIDSSTLGSALVSKSPNSVKAGFQQIFEKIDATITAALANRQTLPAEQAVLYRRDVERRDFTTVMSDLRECNSICQELVQSIQKDGSTAGLIPIQNGFNDLDNCINRLIDDLKTLPRLSSSDSQQLLNYINNTLEPCIKAVINALISKKSQFRAVGLSRSICNDIGEAAKSMNSFFSALVNIVSSDKQAAAKQSQSVVAADLQRGSNAFC